MKIVGRYTLGAALISMTLVFDSAPASATSYRHIRTLHQLATVDRALQSFFHDADRFPTTQEGLKALVERPTGDLSSWRGPYTDSGELVDAWGQNLQYAYPAVHGSLAFDLYSLGTNGTDDSGAADDLSNWAHYDSKQYPMADSLNEIFMWVIVLDFPIFLILCAVFFTVRRFGRRITA